MSPELRPAYARGVWDGLVLAALVLCAVLLALGGCAKSVGPDDLDRRMAIERIQSFSDYVGFEARFSDAGGRTLGMRGGELCGPDVLLVLPADAVAIARDAGFKSLACLGDHGEYALVAIGEVR